LAPQNKLGGLPHANSAPTSSNVSLKF